MNKTHQTLAQRSSDPVNIWCRGHYRAKESWNVPWSGSSLLHPGLISEGEDEGQKANIPEIGRGNSWQSSGWPRMHRREEQARVEECEERGDQIRWKVPAGGRLGKQEGNRVSAALPASWIGTQSLGWPPSCPAGRLEMHCTCLLDIPHIPSPSSPPLASHPGGKGSKLSPFMASRGGQMGRVVRDQGFWEAGGAWGVTTLWGWRGTVKREAVPSLMGWIPKSRDPLLGCRGSKRQTASPRGRKTSEGAVWGRVTVGLPSVFCGPLITANLCWGSRGFASSEVLEKNWV